MFTMSSNSRPTLPRSLSSTTSIPKTNKPRLYIAIYQRGGGSSSCSFTTSHSQCDSYHWSFIVGPQTALRKDPGTRYHLAHCTSPIIPSSSSSRRASTSTTLLYEENDIPTHLPASTALIRIAIAKVTNPDRLTHLLRSLALALPHSHSLSTPSSSSSDPSYTCLTFIKSAYQTLITSHPSCLKTYLNPSDWNDIEHCARKYSKKKRDQRRFTPDTNMNMNVNRRWDVDCVSTFNFWENRETTA